MRVWPLLNRRLSRHFQGVLQHPLPSENAAQGRYGRFFLRDLPDSRAAGTHGACRARIRTISGALVPRDNQGENVATIKMRMPRRLAAL